MADPKPDETQKPVEQPEPKGDSSERKETKLRHKDGTLKTRDEQIQWDVEQAGG